MKTIKLVVTPKDSPALYINVEGTLKDGAAVFTEEALLLALLQLPLIATPNMDGATITSHPDNLVEYQKQQEEAKAVCAHEEKLKQEASLRSDRDAHIAKDIENRFAYHAPTGGKKELHENVRNNLKEMALHFTKIMPESRELSTAITKLEEAMMWANAGIARNPEKV